MRFVCRRSVSMNDTVIRFAFRYRQTTDDL
jgi:hypothetical protein